MHDSSSRHNETEDDEEQQQLQQRPAASKSSARDDIILYDIAPCVKWTSETVFKKDNNAYHKYLQMQNENSNLLYRMGSWIKTSFRISNTDNTIKFLLTSDKPWNKWKLVVSKSGCIGILRENYLELFNVANDPIWQVEITTNFIVVCSIAFDKNDEFLAFSDEYGNILFFSVNDGEVVSSYTEITSIGFENACCKFFFIDCEEINCKSFGSDITQLMITASYAGSFNVFTVDTKYRMSKIHTIAFGKDIQCGIYCAEIDSTSQYLFVGGFASSNASGKQSCPSSGIYAWRVLNQEPWLKRAEILDSSSSSQQYKKNLTKMNFAKTEYVTKLAISPDNKSIVALYVSGKIALFTYPNLKHQKEWFMTEQPSYDELNMDIMENPYQLKIFEQIYSQSDFRVLDIGWWSEKVLILVRGTGLMSLVSSEDFTNLMGRNHQWLKPYASLYSHPANGFLVLECYCSLSSQTSLKRLSMSSSSEFNEDSAGNLSDANDDLFDANNEDEEEGEDSESLFSLAKQTIRGQLYNLSGIERFKLLPKKLKILRRKVSLLHFKSTTPEELFKKKLDAEEYGEALQLAKTYSLDTDLVYQKQWRSRPISKSTINDFLRKISKRSWVLTECLERVSTNLDTTKALIDFGLHGTDLDSLVAIQDHDDNKFLYSQEPVIDDADGSDVRDKFNPEYQRERKRKLQELKDAKLDQVDVENLTLMQKELCSVRLRLLSYMDRLNVYELILGGASEAAENFDVEKFKQIRTMPILQVAFEYARDGDAEAVQILLSYYDHELRGHHLEILSNFPETAHPDEYAKLLPSIRNGKVQFFDEPDELRSDKDWIESDKFAHLVAQLQQYKNESKRPDQALSADEVQKWYHDRTLDIERLSGLSDVALSFAELAIANGCQNMNDVIEDLRSLCTLHYECNKSIRTNYTLESLRKLGESEKLALIMRHAYAPENEFYSKNVQEWLLPFIARRPTLHQREKLLRTYLLEMSKESLHACLKIYQLKLKKLNEATVDAKSAKVKLDAPSGALNLLNDINVVSIIFDCLYENEKPEQVDLSAQIVHEISVSVTVLDKTSGSSPAVSFNDSISNNAASGKVPITAQQFGQLKVIQDHLKACLVLRKYGLYKTLAYIKESCKSAESCREALTKLTTFASKKATNSKIGEWIDLERDLKSLQSSIYSELVSYQECYEILLSRMLSSRSMDNIKQALNWLEKVYAANKEKAIDLTIKASQEYFNASANFYDEDMDFAKACLGQASQLLFGPGKNASDMPDEMVMDAATKECAELIEAEYYLIQATKLLADLNYSILPVKVRLNEDRLSIVKDILASNDQAYKDHEKLIKLAKFLRINQATKAGKIKESEQPEVMVLVAEKAIAKNNLNVLSQMCAQLIKINHAKAWQCAHLLAYRQVVSLIEQYKISYHGEVPRNPQGQATMLVFKALRGHKFTLSAFSFNGKERLIKILREIVDLLDFSITHCDLDSIETILSEKNDVLVALERMNEEASPTERSSRASETNETPTRLAIENLVAKYLYNESFSPNELAAFTERNEKLSAALERLLENQRAYLDSPHRERSQAFLAAFTAFYNIVVALEVNVACAFLIEAPDEILKLVDSVIVINNKSIEYEFVLYCLALNLVQLSYVAKLKQALQSSKKLIRLFNEQAFFYRLSSSTVIEFVRANYLDKSSTRLGERLSLSECARTNSFKISNSLMKNFTEYNQNNKLKQLNSGVDIHRFEHDQAYKNDTILGLTLCISTFDLACSLAQFHEFDMWKVYMSFTEFLLTECSIVESGVEKPNENSLTLAELEAKVTPLLPVLKSKEAAFADEMFKRILPLIDGKDLDKLAIFYGFLGTDESETHVKILKKLKSIGLKDLDYTRLLKFPNETIEAYLDETNIVFFAKIYPKLAAGGDKQQQQNPSRIHALWCLKKLRQHISEDKSKDDFDRLNKLDDCLDKLKESLKKIDTEHDFLYFARELILSASSIERLSVSVRKELTKRISKLLKQAQAKTQPASGASSEAFLAELAKMQSHLKLIEGVEAVFKSQESDKCAAYLRLFDLQLGYNSYLSDQSDVKANGGESVARKDDAFVEHNYKKIADILIDMLFDGFSFEVVYSLIDLLQMSKLVSLKELITMSLVKLNEYSSSSKDSEAAEEKKSLLEKKKSFRGYDKLQTLLKAISAHLNQADKAKNGTEAGQQSRKLKATKSNPPVNEANSSANRKKFEEDVLDCMRLFCNDQHVDISLRLVILEELKNSFSMKSEDLTLLLVYKTNAIIESRPVFKSQVQPVDSAIFEEEEGSLAELLSTLIELSESKEDGSALINLLRVLPPFEFAQTCGEETSTNPWNVVLLKLFDLNYPIVDLVKSLKAEGSLATADIKFLKKKLLSAAEAADEKSLQANKLSYLKLCLVFRDESLLKDFFASVKFSFEKHLNEAGEETSLDAILEAYMKHGDLHGYAELAEPARATVSQMIESFIENKQFMELLMDDNFYLKLINTYLYSFFYVHVLKYESKQSLYGIVRTLKQNGHAVEAARLLLEIENFCNPFKILSVSLNSIQNFS